MPAICRFFGIVISMYFDDHLPAHFHVRYGDYRAKLTIETLEITEGEVPRRALAMVLEWAALHRTELRQNWQRARQGLPLWPITPLE
jgi:hypothetical protein